MIDGNGAVYVDELWQYLNRRWVSGSSESAPSAAGPPPPTSEHFARSTGEVLGVSVVCSAHEQLVTQPGIDNGTHTVPDFANAIRRHKLIAAIERSGGIRGARESVAHPANTPRLDGGP